MKVAWNINLNNVRAGTQTIISIRELLMVHLVVNIRIKKVINNSDHSLTNETSTPHYPHSPCRQCFEHSEYVHHSHSLWRVFHAVLSGTPCLYQQRKEIHNKANRLSPLFIYPIRHLLP